jgi:hypothetical protein
LKVVEYERGTARIRQTTEVRPDVHKLLTVLKIDAPPKIHAAQTVLAASAPEPTVA